VSVIVVEAVCPLVDVALTTNLCVPLDSDVRSRIPVSP